MERTDLGVLTEMLSDIFLIRSVTMTIRKVFITLFWPVCFPVQATLWSPIMNMD